MARLSKPAGKANVKPENDWRIVGFREVDHFTCVAIEANGVGERRPFDPRAGKHCDDLEFQREMDERADQAKAVKLAWRAARLAEAEELISRLRRQYQAEGRVLKLRDLMRELRFRQRAKDEAEQPVKAGNIGGALAALEADEWANAPIVRVDQPQEEEA